MKRSIPLKYLFIICLFFGSEGLYAFPWLPFGPDGGDARAFAADPSDRMHLYLGTVNGWIYESRDGGEKWVRLARVGKRDDLVLDHISVDRQNPRRLLVGVWVLGSPDGGLYVSSDGGATWTENADLHGQSIRALTNSSSDPKIYVAGTLEGIYRSADGGTHWKLISPTGSKEIHEVESIAVDPKDPQTIYAGTWHLPWKSTDGGEHWNNIKTGIIDDSDVFSIIIDPKDPKTVYASACSGIYKSDNSGDAFQKVQGIPSTARRTRVLMQDPQHLDIVFAGTTEGLFRSSDAGKNWIRTTGPEVIVNDVYVDPSNSERVFLATDRGGVLASRDGGLSFRPSNAGFSARQIVAYTADERSSARIYVGVVNDKEWGGVFVSENGGLSWVQQSTGLGGRDVFSLGQAPDGTILAGTGHGIFRLVSGTWSRVEDVRLDLTPAAKVAAKASKTTRGGSEMRAGATHPSSSKIVTKRASAMPSFDGVTFAITRVGDAVFAATSQGVLVSRTSGESWRLVPELGSQEWQAIASARQTIGVSSLTRMMLSQDAGKSWATVNLPGGMNQISAMAVDDRGGIWVGSREGVFVSRDRGLSWENPKNLLIRDVNSIFFDSAGQRMLMTANESTRIAFGVSVPEGKVTFWDTGWYLRMARPMGDHLVGATLFDGFVVQPQMVNSPEARGRP